MLALVAAGKAILYDTLDPDLFWHLRVAEQLHQHGVGPLVDDLSYASIKKPWTPYSWMAELAMKAIWDVAGFRGAIATQAMLMAAWVTFIALSAHELARRGQDHHRGNPLAAILATVFAMYLSLPFFSFRPVTFAFVMAAACAWLLLRDRRMDETSRAVWGVIPITVFATNCHFFSIAVPLWVLALLVGSVAERATDSCKRYGMMLWLTVLAWCTTPLLPGVLRQMWSYGTADPMVDAGIIAELRPFWVDPICTAAVATAVALAYHARKRLRIGEWLWLLGSLVLYVRYSRFAPAYAPIAAATLAIGLPKFTGQALQRAWVRAATMYIIALGILRLIIAFPGPRTSMDQWINRHAAYAAGYPAGAAEFVSQHIQPRSGHLLNEFTWGGYLAWALEGKYQVFLDGRTQLYSPKLWTSLYLTSTDESRMILEDTCADAAILPLKKSRFSAALKAMGWQVAYYDDLAEVLVPPQDQFLADGSED
jgi:hypothetical protein